MNVNLLTKTTSEEYFTRWGNFTGICYKKGVPSADGQTTNNPVAVAKHCLKTGHLSGCRHIYFDFLVTGVSRACTHQLVRHTVGIVFNQQSLRYVNPLDNGGVGFALPTEAADDAMLKYLYAQAFGVAQTAYKQIHDRIIQRGGTPERARECARMVMPMAVQSSISMSLNLEAAINLCKKRECARAEAEIQELANKVHAELVACVPELDPYLGPPCRIGQKCKEKECPRHK